MASKLKELKSALIELQQILETQSSVSLELKEFLILKFLVYNFYNESLLHFNPITNIRKALAPDYEYFYTGLMNLQTRLTFYFDDDTPKEILMNALKSSSYSISSAIKNILDIPKFDLLYIQTMTYFMNYLPWKYSCKSINLEIKDDSMVTIWQDLALNEVTHYLKTKVAQLTEAPPIVDYASLHFLKIILTEFSPAQIFYLIDKNIKVAHSALTSKFNPHANLGHACILAMEHEINHYRGSNKQVKSLAKRPIWFPRSLFQDFVFTNWIKLSESPFHIPVRKEFIKTRLIVA